MRGRIFFSFIVCALLLIACTAKDTVPENILEPREMERIVWDVLQADELALQKKIADSTIGLKEESFHLYDQVFSIHKTTRAQFFSSYRFYQEHPDRYKALMDGVKRIGEKEKKAIQAATR